MSSDSRRKKDDRDVGTLIRAAGPRPSVPRERSERVRAAAHATWARETRRSATRRRWLVAGAVALAASLALALVGPRLLPLVGRGLAPATQAGVRVEALSGSAWAQRLGATGAEDPGALAPGDPVGPETEVRTADGSRLALRLASGHSVRLDHATRLRVTEGGGLFLAEGAIYVDSRDVREAPPASPRPAGAAVALTVQTPFGTIEEIGTQFEVRLDSDAVRVRLREGAVILHHQDDSYPVAVGTEFRLAADGTTETAALPSHDARWDWVAAVAPPFELEGRTARAFLDWVARERGLQLVFADAQLARSADETILAGTLRTHSLDQALDLVLPTCRMSHRVVDGRLLVDAEPGGS